MARRLALLTPLLAALLVAGHVWMGPNPKVAGVERQVQKGGTSMTLDSVTNSPAPPKTDEEWKKILTPEQYRVARQKGTEAPFSGEYVKTDREGVYRCVCCGAPLFSSETKFDAHCGWPSFWKALEEGNIKSLEDHSHGMHRTEIQCRHCGAHLGHLFDDGPRPTGLRYCINSVSLKLDEKKPPDAKQ